MPVSIKLEYRFLNRWDKDLDIAIEEALEEISPVLERYAKANHKYQNRTGLLTSQTFAEAIKTQLIFGNDAPYAEYVKEPHGTWDGDDWIQEALVDNREFILSTIEKHITNKLNGA